MSLAPDAPPPATAGRDPTRFILIETSHPGNVGSAARAMKVMGFSDLVLVAPRFADVLSREETVAMASGAADVLARARVVDTLDAALDGIELLCATAMTPRDFGPPTAAPRDAFPALAAEGARMGFLFGSERYGLRNDEVWRCHLTLSLPTAPDYGSLNLAQAIQLVAYEWRQALGGYAVEARTPARALAPLPAVEGMLAHWERALVDIGFLDPAVPGKLMPRLEQLFHRARLGTEEVHILRGIARAMSRVAADGAGAAAGTATPAARDDDPPPNRAAGGDR